MKRLQVKLGGEYTPVWLVKRIPGPFIGITLWPFGIFIEDDQWLFIIGGGNPDGEQILSTQAEEVILHELIHWRQQREMLGIFFYLWYGIEWVIKALTPPVGAYKDLGFEREANKYEGDQFYLSIRKRYAWFKFIKG